ncbi:amino acid adenylation domain-containing protein [Vibrio pectenicida]|uniref:Amino acid adenylation domain-containing protein n=1 Tax=Vibrio pectenicida TaxID=62763 RepID=A0A7Y3ZXS3_9VIBR|nr:non-ribosomal peptide synthetase [Vibrio pectenicida]NOH71055.1 amino acid adenylation domain-containing protein [Vibrio pectenicida]
MNQSEHSSSIPVAKLSLTSNQNWLLTTQRQRAEQQSIANFIYQELDFQDIASNRLEKAIKVLIAQHPMLHAVLSDDFYLHLTKSNQIDVITINDLSQHSDQDVNEQIAYVRATLTKKPTKNTISVVLNILPASKIRLHVRFNSVIVDQPSAVLFFEQLNQILMGSAQECKDLELVVNTHNQFLEDAIHNTNSDSAYWNEQILSLPRSANLPTVCEPEKITDTGITRHTLKLSSDKWQHLVTHSKQHNIQPELVLASVFSSVLSLWGQQDNLMLRLDLNAKRDSRYVIGQYIQPLLVSFTGYEQSFLSLAKTNQQSFEQAYPHRQTSIFQLVRQLAKLSEGHRYPANIAFSSELSQNNVLDRLGWGCRQSANTWLSLHALIEQGQLILQWDSQDSLFPQDMVQDMVSSYSHLLESLCKPDSDWKQSLAVKLPDHQARVRSLINHDAGKHELPHGLLHDRFWQHATSSPNALAVIHGQQSLDYKTLALYAQSCAGALITAGVKPGDRVAISMNKGIGQIVSVLGILYAGAIYVPVSLDQPQERREGIYQGAGIQVILIDKTELKNSAINHDFNYLDWQVAQKHQPIKIPQIVKPSEPAYIIYTSGSTGTPKGVVISHQGALNTCVSLNQKYTVSAEDRILALSALHFDLSVYDIFGLLSAGGAIVLVDEAQRRDPSAWAQSIEHHQVTMWNSVPALFDMLLTYASSFKSTAPEKLRLTMLSGDWIGLDLPQRYRLHRVDGQFIAMGGATEASIWSNVYDVKQVPTEWRSIPYGYPLARQQYRVVDDLGRDCPNWVSGELWIGGDGVALGYFNDEQRTRAQFIAIDDHVWYRTGDMGCYWPDGTLEFLGRKDKQVKIGGYRIELGEIELALNSIQGVQRAITIAVGNKDKTLAAFVVTELVQNLLDAEKVQHLLSEQLPSYMIPQRIIFLDALPLTSNGKVDHKALTHMTSRKRKNSAPINTPLMTESEMKIGEIWIDILSESELNKSSNFFQLGGDAYSAIEFIRRCHQAGYPAKFSMLYRYPSIESLVMVLDRYRLTSLQGA